jgi:hypothetical protein
MTKRNIYSDFAADITWIQDCIGRDVSSLPRSMKTAGLYFTTKRLRILEGSDLGSFSPSIGRPVPYAAFWFADALSLDQPEFVRKMAIAMVYNSLTTTITDDMKDSSGGRRANLEFLKEYWNHKYVETTSSVFPSDSAFWKISRIAGDEQRRYDKWNSCFDETSEFDPYSDEFLGSASRYFVAVVLPPLAGLAVRAGKPHEINRINRFLNDFSKGWRVFDDLMDWREDVNVAHFNRSSVLYYVVSRLPAGTTMKPDHVLSSFLSQEFVEDTYGAILRNLKLAANDICPLQNPYLSTFIKNQLEFHSKRRNALLNSSKKTLADLASLLSRAPANPTSKAQM